MAIDFERGDPNAPKGHALLYFRSSLNPEEILGTYVICFPISFDVAKYVPPFLMGQVSGIDPKDMSALAYPPAPEKLDGHSALVKLAASREDDVLFCGTLDPSDVPAGMMAVNDAVRDYNEKYASFAGSAASDETVVEPGTSGTPPTITRAGSPHVWASTASIFSGIRIRRLLQARLSALCHRWRRCRRVSHSSWPP